MTLAHKVIDDTFAQNGSSPHADALGAVAPRKTLFDKAAAYTAAREVQAAGVYPYYAPIEASTTSEVRIRG